MSSFSEHHSSSPDDSVFQSFEFEELPIPVDEEGYTRSFLLEEPSLTTKESEFLEFYNKYGFVVINGVLTETQVAETLSEIWSDLESFDWSRYDTENNYQQLDRNNPATWGDNSFATSREGFLGLDVAIGKIAWRNRQLPSLYRCFSVILGLQKLWSSVDRYGVIRPTKNISTERLNEVANGARISGNEESTLEEIIKKKNSGKLLDHPEWRTVSKWLHWDINPWQWHAGNGDSYTFDNFIQENNGTSPEVNLQRSKLQGLINLVENKKGDGGFLCVPGFHNQLGEYCSHTGDTDYKKKHDTTMDFVMLPEHDVMQSFSQCVTMRAGSVLIWNSLLPHCNYPNESHRMCQYIKMFPAQEDSKSLLQRQREIKELLGTHHDSVSPLGAKLLGLDRF